MLATAIKAVPGVRAALELRRAIAARLWPVEPPIEAEASFWRPFDPARATFTAAQLDPLQVGRSLSRYGCAFIKGLFDPVTLGSFDATISRNLQGIEQRRLGNGVPLYFAGIDSREAVQAAFNRNYPALFVPAQMKGLDCASLPRHVFQRLRATGLDPLLARMLKLERLRTSAAICHIRCFETPPSSEGKPSEESLEFHQDNKLYQIRPEIFTLWFPFRYEHGTMASLEFLPIRPRGCLPCVTACGISRDAYPQERFWRPAYELGDAVIISGYSPHRTYYPDAIAKDRTSVDFRFFPTDVPSPIYAD